MQRAKGKGHHAAVNALSSSGSHLMVPVEDQKLLDLSTWAELLDCVVETWCLYRGCGDYQSGTHNQHRPSPLNLNRLHGNVG